MIEQKFPRYQNENRIFWKIIDFKVKTYFLDNV